MIIYIQNITAEDEVMQETMGQIIKRLRKEKNLTQEDLAMQLGVTFQAVSKWENGLGMPDISQVVPLAHIFGVSTDVLFGISGTNDKDEVVKIIKNAQSLLTRPLTAKGLLKKYSALQDGLKVYPNNTTLLLETLETGLALSYPENTVYDAEHAKPIYHACIRYANLIISYSPNATDVLRTHMIMVILHSAYGDFKNAYAHAQHFPWRTDLNIHVMYAYLAHWKKDYETEVQSCQYGVLFYLQALMNIVLRLSQAYSTLEKNKDAVKTLETALGLINCIFKEEDVLPPIHHREQGDLYKVLAEIYLKDGNTDMALHYLKKMADYDTMEYEKISINTPMCSPLFKSIPHGLYRKRIDCHQNLIAKLTDECFESLTDNEQYKQLLKTAGI